MTIHPYNSPIDWFDNQNKLYLAPKTFRATTALIVNLRFRLPNKPKLQIAEYSKTSTSTLIKGLKVQRWVAGNHESSAHIDDLPLDRRKHPK